MPDDNQPDDTRPDDNQLAETRPDRARPDASPPETRPEATSERRLSVRPWWDPELAVGGHDPLGPYAETHWLPLLGPSATLALRWLSRELRERPGGFEVDLMDFARHLGLGGRRGRNNAGNRALERLCRFRLARWGEHLEVRTHVPELPPNLRRRLPRPNSPRAAPSPAGSGPAPGQRVAS